MFTCVKILMLDIVDSYEQLQETHISGIYSLDSTPPERCLQVNPVAISLLGSSSWNFVEFHVLIFCNLIFDASH